MNYFNKLPTINYNGFSAKNLLSRAVISESTRNNNSIYYPYTIQEDDGRIDNLSQNYYDNPGYTWLIWHTNNIIDPYYGTPLTDIDLYAFIDSKYGSYSEAERKIAFYRLNWESDSRNLTIEQYNLLQPSEKKYWDPQIDLNFQTTGYARRKENRIINTNKVLYITLEPINSVNFIDDEKVFYNSTTFGWVSSLDTNALYLQHITGAFTEGIVIEGETSGAKASINSVTVISETSAGENPLYWDAISFAQYEQEENEKKRDILLMDVRYKAQIETELKRVMSAT